jgi:peptidoglycan hydrolase-like protein with peptidoglycan-binding domain
MSKTKSDETRELQRRLARAGYYHGAIDGILGPQTRRAIQAYERDHGGGRPKGSKGPKDGKGKNGGYRKGGKITIVLEEYCAKDLFIALATALGAPVNWKKQGKKQGKKGGPKTPKNGPKGPKNGPKGPKGGPKGPKGGPKGPKGGPKGPKGGPYGYKASRGSARTRRG